MVDHHPGHRTGGRGSGQLGYFRATLRADRWHPRDPHV